MCSLYLCGSVHVHACEFDAESSMYVCVCVVFGVSACDVCGFVSVFWVWVCLWPLYICLMLCIWLYGVISLFCACLCMSLYGMGV